MPAAVADVITAANADRVRTRLVGEAANIPTTQQARLRLHDRGVVTIPDYVANGGANAWWWWTLLGTIEADAGQAFRQVSTVIRDTVRRLLEVADARGVAPAVAARELATENLDRLAATLGEEGSDATLPPAR